ncbi:MAG: MFS transporter, partial [Alphaproteobacteria bacterium]|nr:MFS transporter [Alphaproteobacteria bacterium]
FGAVFLEGIALYGVTPYVAPLLEQRGRGGPFEAGIVITAFALGAFMFTATVSYSLRLFTRYQLMFAGGFFSACSALSLVFDMPWQFYFAGFTLAGIGYMMVHNSIQAEVAELAPALRGSAFAMHSCSFFSGQSLGPILFGLLMTPIGASGAALAFAMLVLLIGPAVSLIFRRLPPSAET